MFQAPAIDMKQTGRRIQKLCRVNGYSVRDLQRYLLIGCPQSIYNWFHGKTLPSLDHLFALSVLLHIPMNWMLVAEPEVCKRQHIRRLTRHPQMQRMRTYRKKLDRPLKSSWTADKSETIR